jgi:hypothetical protein
MWYLRVSNSNTVASTNCFHFTDQQTYERCTEGGKIVFTDAPDSHAKIGDLYSELSVARETITTLEKRIASLKNNVWNEKGSIVISLPRLSLANDT